MKLIAQGILSAAEPGTGRAVAKQVHLAAFDDGEILATYRVGAASDSDVGNAEIRRSVDGGRTWSAPETPWATAFEGRRGTLYAPSLTVLRGDDLLACVLWVDRDEFPGEPIFSPQTEGCLPMRILLADSSDRGRTWTPWREVRMPADVGPPSLTSPVRRLASGRLLLSVESNKEYRDASPWFQRVVYLYSSDEARTWTKPVTVCQDPTGRIRNWDQRVNVAPDARLVSFTWTYDSETVTYRDIHRRVSVDEGLTWSAPEPLGVTDQAGHPAILPDGRVVLPWVDHFETHSLRVRSAAAIDAPLDPASEVVLHASTAAVAGEGTDGGEALLAMGTWTFGSPFALGLRDGSVLVAAYIGDTDAAIGIDWFLLDPNG
ncbi:MAG TPA: sialidase family protein [Candidatus Saccharimonadales bacterium]|nr:sialidase family protein [Candidatus Saccharimonadales bacterium]